MQRVAADGGCDSITGQWGILFYLFLSYRAFADAHCIRDGRKIPHFSCLKETNNSLIGS